MGRREIQPVLALPKLFVLRRQRVEEAESQLARERLTQRCVGYVVQLSVERVERLY